MFWSISTSTPGRSTEKNTRLQASKISDTLLIDIHLQAPPFNRQIDAIKNPEFRDSNQSYRSAIKELKAEGKGTIDHHPEINEKDLKTLYQSIHMSTSTPYGLQNKVQFDIRLYTFAGEELKTSIP